MSDIAIYNEDVLSTFSGSVDEATFDLVSYTHSYEKYISNRDYHYTCDDEGVDDFYVQIRNDHLPHLLALSKKHHSNLPEYQAPKVFKHLKNDWNLEFLEKSDPGYYEEFKLRILGTFYLYQMINLINCQVRVPLPKAHRMKQRCIDFIISPKNSTPILYTLELQTAGEKRDGYSIYFPVSLRVKDRKAILETKEIFPSLKEIHIVRKNKKKHKPKRKKFS